MNYFHFIGIDVSKETFDASFLKSDSWVDQHQEFSNSEKGFEEFLKWIRSKVIDVRECLFCAESMGNYVLDLSLWLYNQQLHLVLACPLSIKKSMGIQRGKSDKIDALKIAKYIRSHYKDLSLFSPKEEAIEQLNSWLIIRKGLVKQKKSLSQLLRGEEKQNQYYNKSVQISFLQEGLARCKKQIKEIEKQIKFIFDQYVELNKNKELLESIPGIGLINATVLICSTQNFTKFKNQRKFACYCGVAPFEHTSGSSIRGKTRVSPIANLKIRTLLTSAAVTAVKWDKQLKTYYHRKLKEGKHKASVLNAVKAKLIARCFAVIKRQEPFIKLDF